MYSRQYCKLDTVSKNGLSIVTLKNLSNEKRTHYPENWHSNSRFVLKATTTGVFFSLLRFFDVIIDDPFFDAVIYFSDQNVLSGT